MYTNLSLRVPRTARTTQHAFSPLCRHGSTSEQSRTHHHQRQALFWSTRELCSAEGCHWDHTLGNCIIVQEQGSPSDSGENRVQHTGWSGDIIAELFVVCNTWLCMLSLLIGRCNKWQERYCLGAKEVSQVTLLDSPTSWLPPFQVYNNFTWWPYWSAGEDLDLRKQDLCVGGSSFWDYRELWLSKAHNLKNVVDL